MWASHVLTAQDELLPFFIYGKCEFLTVATGESFPIRLKQKAVLFSLIVIKKNGHMKSGW